jgi:hypothetical protein
MPSRRTVATALVQMARLAFGALLRALTAIGGAVAGYGATGMFTTAGLMPPNALVYAGLVLCGLAAALLWSAERRLSGLWPALLIGLPFSLYAFSSLGVQECRAPYLPITPNYSCAPVGSHALAVIAPLVTASGSR